MKRAIGLIFLSLTYGFTQAQVTIEISSIPENSPKDIRIYVTGNFNDWQANLPQYELKRNQKGNFEITITHYLDSILEFKFTAGDWDHIESDHNYLPRPNRKINASQTSYYEATIDNWQEVNRGSGADVYLFTVLTAIAFSFLLVWLTNRYTNKFTFAKVGIPLGLSIGSILIGLVFLKYNTYQWEPILQYLKWVAALLTGWGLFKVYQKKLNLGSLFLPMFFSISLILFASVASVLLGGIAAFAVFPIYSSIILIQASVFLYGFLGLEISIKPKVESSDSNALLISEFERLVINEKVFLEPELTVESLAAQMGIHRNMLSKIINETYGTRFTDYINQLRVEEYVNLANSPGTLDKFTFFGLAQKVGFNSKSAFLRTFKSIKGMTPKEYFKTNQ